MLAKWHDRAKALKREIHALYLACKDPRVPWYARLLVAGIVAYALSPIDLIPDFIPILGYLDDLVLIPLGLALAIRPIPPSVLAECREEVRRVVAAGKPVNRAAVGVIIALWVALAGVVITLALRQIR